jgi:hypothetical protein
VLVALLVLARQVVILGLMQRATPLLRLPRKVCSPMVAGLSLVVRPAQVLAQLPILVVLAAAAVFPMLAAAVRQAHRVLVVLVVLLRLQILAVAVEVRMVALPVMVV